VHRFYYTKIYSPQIGSQSDHIVDDLLQHATLMISLILVLDVSQNYIVNHSTEVLVTETCHTAEGVQDNADDIFRGA